ncbi:outer membrane protein [Aeromonas hydrophila]|uniref:outer membrane protein n=1 Tax=Aeromonas hydrophila TaxID=644 RepID=UPI003986C1DC
MKMKMKMKSMYLLFFVISVTQHVHAEGYYISGRYLTGNQYADNMDTSLRPRVGNFIEVDKQDSLKRGAFAFGYMFDNHWQLELEYNSKIDSEYQTGSSRFTNSFNNYRVSSEKWMFNTYRTLPISEQFSIYGLAGLGLAKIKVGGWQRVETNQFSANSQTNLVYALGTGMRIDVSKYIFVDLGYRYTGLGKVESGFNNFENFSGLKDEQLKANLSEQEIFFGLTYKF